jgi:hypothetical protein
MGIKYRKDQTGKLDRLVKRLIKQEPDYHNLRHLNLLLVWREGRPKRDPDGGFIAAEASIIPKRTRDLFGFDAQIEFSEDIWNQLSSGWHERLVWHELRHLEVDMEEDETSGKQVPARDKEGRVVVYIKGHDIALRTFKAEIDKYGIDVDEVEMMKFISSRYVRSKKGVVKRFARPRALCDVADSAEEAAEEIVETNVENPAPRKSRKKKTSKRAVKSQKKAARSLKRHA